jgi:hypothetical protein
VTGVQTCALPISNHFSFILHTVSNVRMKMRRESEVLIKEYI